MYGSSFCMRTDSPRRSSNMPIEALVRPLPSELTTPPVTKICLVIRAPSPDCRQIFAGRPNLGHDDDPPRGGKSHFSIQREDRHAAGASEKLLSARKITL